MPWWSWIVIWVALAIVSLLYLGLLGYRLFRNFLKTVDTLHIASEQLGSRPAPDPQPDERAALVPELGIFADPQAARTFYEESKNHRKDIRRQRRIAHKTHRGQPQALRDLRICGSDDVG